MPPPNSRKISVKNKQSTISRFFTSASPNTSSIEADNSQGRELKEPESHTQSKRPAIDDADNPTEPDGKRRKTDSLDKALDETRHKLQNFASTFDQDSFNDISNACSPDCTTNDVVPGTSQVNGAAEIKKQSNEDKSSSFNLSAFSNKKVPVQSKNAKPNQATPDNSIKYTPLEKQVVDIKEKNPDVLLFVECGYKYRFFGEDAEIAAKELNIFCHLDHNFMTASIPTHRLHVHVRRLVAKGYKVGVVKQMETAALKAASDNKNAPFTRHLAALYTKATLIGEDIDPMSNAESGSSAETVTSHLTCIFESDGAEKKGKPHTLAIASVEPATGEVVFDMFDDGITRDNLETRLTHIKPVEILMPQTLSSNSMKLVSQLVAQSASCDDRIRIETRPDADFNLADAQRELMEFYKNVQKTGNGPNDGAGERRALDAADVLNLPKPVICCLHALIIYLKEFNLHKILQITSNFRKFSTEKKYMQLSASCLRNLELFQNITDGKEHGSLVWIIDRTKTKFGSRLLRQWLAKPLLDKKKIEDRLDAVTEIMKSDNLAIKKLRDLLPTLPDLEKALTSVIHGKISPFDFCQLTSCLENVHKEVVIHSESIESHIKSSLLHQCVKDLSGLLSGISGWAQAIDAASAKSGDKANMFVHEFKHSGIVECKKDIEKIMNEIMDHRKRVRLTLRLPALDYSTVLGTEFLFEIKHNQSSLVPKDWSKINSTKAVSRYHTPFVIETVKRLSQKREELLIEANNEWNKFIGAFETDYASYKKAVYCLASLDCLFALTDVAAQPGYCRPQLNTMGTCIDIQDGRHPVIDALIGENEQFVPNSCSLSTSGKLGMIITGPNMGGKSSYIKQVALITILAQIGSYVPAESANIGMVDAVYIRMGASDELFKGRSTFMVELQEAANIMEKATERSLVILDELGRGTSTHDGVAIAYATLKHFLTKVQCLVLFVTHYPPLAEMEKMFPDQITNNHMSFFVTDDSDEDSITFLYELKEGMAERSYGLNVARLASIPDEIVKSAAIKSKDLEALIADKRSNNAMFRKVFEDPPDLESMARIFKQ